jgi:hypothetical protein
MMELSYMFERHLRLRNVKMTHRRCTYCHCKIARSKYENTTKWCHYQNNLNRSLIKWCCKMPESVDSFSVTKSLKQCLHIHQKEGYPTDFLPTYADLQC